MKAVQRMLRLILCILYIFFKKSACKHKRKNIVTVNVKNNRNLITNHFFSFFEKTLVSNVKSSALFELELTVEVHSPDKLNKLHTIAARNNLLDFFTSFGFIVNPYFVISFL